MTSAALDHTQDDTVAIRTISSLILGDIDVAEDIIMHFPNALWGFPDQHDYALVPGARDGMWWLQSLTDEGTTFVLADPFALDAAYSVDIGETEGHTLEIEQPTDAFGLVMLSLPATTSESITANLRAPIVFNLARRRAMQVVSRDDKHELQRVISLEVFPALDGGVRPQ